MANSSTQAALAIQPSVVLWTTVTRQSATGVTPKSIAGEPIGCEPEYALEICRWARVGLPTAPRLHRQDAWLRLPFEGRIIFEPEEIHEQAAKLVWGALDLIIAWDRATYDELCWLSPEIQLIRDPSAHPDKAVSFSDNSVPGALYISIRRGSGWITPYDLADSIIHEHRHQKLYLLQASAPIVAVDAPLVRSPWRDDLRPPSGLFHAVFVFCGLLRYWQYISQVGDPNILEYAESEVRRIVGMLQTAFPTLLNTALTPIGRQLAHDLLERMESTLAQKM